MTMNIRMPIILAIFVAAATIAEAQTALGNDCSSVVMSMADCLTFVTVGGKAQKPEGGCCSGLKKVLDTNPKCLCESFKNSGKMGIKVDMQKAMSLPSACQVTAPAVSECGISPGTGSIPAIPSLSSAVANATAAAAGQQAAAAAAPVEAHPSSGSSALATSVVFTVVAAVSSALF